MNKIIFACVIIILLACSGVKETIIDSRTGEKMIGFDSDYKYQIGRTKRSDFTAALLSQFEKDSIFLEFNDIPTNSEHPFLLAGWGAGKYITSKGLKPGDSLDKALRLYGKPIATDLEYGLDEKNKIRFSIEGLFYKNMVILIDTASNTVRGVSIGNQFLMNKQYQKASNWFDN